MALRSELAFMNLTCWGNRFNLWTGCFKWRLLSVVFFNGMDIIDPFKKQWQTTKHISCQECHEQPAKAGVDCSAPKGVYI